MVKLPKITSELRSKARQRSKKGLYARDLLTKRLKELKKKGLPLPD